MLIGLFGNVGSAKTLTAVMLGWFLKHYKKAYVVSNFRLEFADLILSAEEILIQLGDLQKNDYNVAILDELGRILTSTNWMSDVNEILGKIFTESRKKGFDIIYTSQSELMVDRNIRRITDIMLLPEFNLKTNVATITPFEMKKIYWIKFRDFCFNGSQYFNLYDTNETITPNKQAIINYYFKKIKNDKEFYDKLVYQAKTKEDRLDLLTFHLNIKVKLARMLLFEILTEFQEE